MLIWNRAKRPLTTNFRLCFWLPASPNFAGHDGKTSRSSLVVAVGRWPNRFNHRTLRIAGTPDPNRTSHPLRCFEKSSVVCYRLRLPLVVNDRTSGCLWQVYHENFILVQGQRRRGARWYFTEIWAEKDFFHATCCPVLCVGACPRSFSPHFDLIPSSFYRISILFLFGLCVFAHALLPISSENIACFDFKMIFQDSVVQNRTLRILATTSFYLLNTDWNPVFYRKDSYHV